MRIGGRSLATCVIPVVQRIVARVLHFHHLTTGKSKCEIHVGNELRDMRHLYMALWCFLCNENFQYFPEGPLVVWHYLRVPRALITKCLHRSPYLLTMGVNDKDFNRELFLDFFILPNTNSATWSADAAASQPLNCRQ